MAAGSRSTGRNPGPQPRTEAQLQPPPEGWIGKVFGPLLLAVRFLSVIPLPAAGAASGMGIGRAASYFPVAGFILGGIAGVAGLVLELLLPVPAAAALFSLFVLFMITGGLHLDGLADTWDAFGAGPDREKRMRILSDSRIGPLGAAALVFVVGLDWSILASLPSSFRFWSLAAAAGAGRWAAVLIAGSYSPAKESGLGSYFIKAVSPRRMVWATAVVLALSWLAVPVAGPAILAAAGIVAYGVGHRLARGFGGMTGDLLGTVIELTQLAFLAAAAIFYHSGMIGAW
ncbi:MAG: adenosylcobinamide-GDP ribazoletransferase [Firmicutes bacterium]|nr:adenosylcobinamide-GDP ribazoletransferase [Bacillota bacterium]